MWGLYKEDGTPFREGFQTQWDAVRTARKKDGSSFKKVEALALKSGIEVFRQFNESLVLTLPTIKDDGTYGGSYVKKTVREKGQKIHRGHWVKKGISRKIRERRFIRSVSLFFYSPRLSLVKGFAGKKIASYFYKEQNVSDLRF